MPKSPLSDLSDDSFIHIKGAKTHNLQSVDLKIPKSSLVVFSGVSGSGKSSIAFDTLYQEGQRRYVESLSSHLRRHLQEFKRPDVESLQGLSPTMAIEQKTAGKNPRSTVGTLTEIYDYLRVLWARLATAYCPQSGQALKAHSQEDVIATITSEYAGRKLMVLAPVVDSKKGQFENERLLWQAQGYTKVLVDGQLLETDKPWDLDPQSHHSMSLVVDRLHFKEDQHIRLCEAVFKALELTEGLCQIFDLEKETHRLFSTHAYSSKSGISYRALEPEDFSFNGPKGMCETCQGLGWAATWDLEKIIDASKSIAQDCCEIATSYQTVRYHNIYNNLARLYHFNIDTPWRELSDEAKQVWLEGLGDQWIRMQFVHPVSGKSWSDRVQWPGVLKEAWQRYQNYKTEKAKNSLRIYLHEGPCQSCHGSRLKPYPSMAKLHGWRLSDFCHLSIAEAKETLESMPWSEPELAIGRELRSEVLKRLTFLIQVGLGYLQLDRTAPTLSGGEAQRVRLSSQIGSGLVGVTYILDEPSIGLHAQDNTRLIETLRHLRDSGTNVIVVEHDEETILSADHVIDFGPGAGREGGKIVYHGDVAGLLKSKESVTGGYLSGRLQLLTPPRRKPGKNKISIKAASHHNLKNIDLEIPLNLFVVVTGVSGSGKSSLITETLFPYLNNKLHHSSLPVGQVESINYKGLEKVICIDQSPIGRLPRSNPATYVKVFDDIRDLFSLLPQAKARGYAAGRFSFNVKEGSCEHCQGMGYIKLEMDFLEDEYIQCPECEGKQFDEATLDISFKGKNIRQVLDMSVDEALDFFSEIPAIEKKLRLLHDVGLGYLPLGQPSPYLSGGEAQRIKLAKELSRSANEPTLYILDEPTTGLHLKDVDRLMKILHRLVDKGHSVLMIEHHLEVIKQADWLIEIGPVGGQKGGYVLATGAVEKIQKTDCPTGRMLQKVLKPSADKKQHEAVSNKCIRVIGARQHNLKGLNVELPHHQMLAFCGPSGSGKSSLLIDTIYAAGQRKYVESLSAYARQFVKPLPEPRVERIEGLSPAVAIETKETSGNLRSTVGTLTEVYDYLRLLFTRLGVAYCPESGKKIEAVDASWVAKQVEQFEAGAKLQLFAPVSASTTQALFDKIDRLKQQGFNRFLWKDEVVEVEELLLHLQASPRKNHLLEVLIDRFKARQTEKERLIASIEQARKIGEGQIIIRPLEGKALCLNMGFCVPSTGKSYPALSPQLFAFNTKEGECEKCRGTGVLKLPDLTSSMKSPDDTIEKWTLQTFGDKASSQLLSLKGFKTFQNKIFSDLTSKERHQLLKGQGPWIGLEAWLYENSHYFHSPSNSLSLLPLVDCTCFECEGARICPLARHVKVQGRALSEFVLAPISHVTSWIEEIAKSVDLAKDTRVLQEILHQLQSRLKFLIQVGLDYLSLNRSAPTLSGGETQRIRLAAQLGSGLCGVLYILDEPGTGLHGKDIDRLIQALQGLKKLGNTLAMVEHQPSLLEACDRLYEMGPAAGQKGGWLVKEASVGELKQDSNSPTGVFLNHPLDFKKKPRKASAHLSIRAASSLELKSIDVDIPLGVFSSLTGVSGSGKSTLVEKVIYKLWKERQGQNFTHHPEGSVEGWDLIERLDYVDSTPLGLTSRSDVGTYTEILTKIRDLYGQLPEAKTKGLKPGHFSFNTRQGMCKSCQGMGYRKIDLKFLPPVKVPCKHCSGFRLNHVSLEVRFKGYHFGQVLQKNAQELIEIFGNVPTVAKRLQTMIDVGLGYLPLGFEVAHLSIGESQRLKLVPRLYRLQPKTLLILDEPCKGLHPQDIDRLHQTLDKWIDKGASILCIEHQVRFISKCDWVIEMGPGSGENGGQIVAQSTPFGLLETDCPTAQQLKRYHSSKDKSPSIEKKPKKSLKT